MQHPSLPLSVDDTAPPRTDVSLPDGRQIALLLRVNARARHIGLRWSVRDDAFVLVLPSLKYRQEGLRFAMQRRHWMAKLLTEQPQRVALCDGTQIRVAETLYTIRHAPNLQGGVLPDGSLLRVSGRAEHLPRRVRDWLKAEARRKIQPQVVAFAAAVGRPVKRISIRDSKTRWGSCSSENSLNFSWRLILAPNHVLTYVVAHEVCHLREMNHSAKFWQWVARLVPDYAAARQWLRQYGATLHRIG